MIIETDAESSKISVSGRIAVLKALADDTRLKIAGALLEAPHCTEELSARLKRTPATISFHLRKLDEAGLVVKQKTQYYLMYSLRPELLNITLASLISPDALAQRDGKTRLDQHRKKILHTFFRDGRLLKMPKQWRKRRIVLERIVSAFEPGYEYDEAEVNHRIHAFADDHCLIRRLLVDEQLMRRNGQKYRRLSGYPHTDTKSAKEADPMTTVTGKVDAKKEAKRAYLEAPRKAGIFRIVNRENGRVYLGSSLNLHGPLNKHRFTLSIGSHINKELQKDWEQYGEKAFEFAIVETIEPSDDPNFNMEDELAILEEIWIEKEQLFTDAAHTYNRRKKIRE